MALPVLEKSWEFELNHRITYPGGSAEMYNATLYDWKETWKGWTVGGATVAGSSDASASWGWGTDYWTSPTFPSNNNPWIVLNLNGGGQVMITRTTTSYVSRLYFSPGGLFTGGGLNTPPTATDQRTIWDTYLFGTQTWAVDCVMQYWHSIDGDCEIMIPYLGNNQYGILMFGRLANAVENWEGGRFYLYNGVNNNLTYSTLNVGSPFRFSYGGTWYTAHGTGLGINRSVVSAYNNQAVNSFSGRSPFPRIGLASKDAGARGWHGRLVDVFWANNQAYPTGAFLEEDVDHPEFKWIQIQALALPWDGVETELVTI